MADSNPFVHVLPLTACIVSICVISQTAATYISAYLVAPSEIVVFIDAVDSSIQENESYDRDLGRVQKLEDKLRLERLLRDIQKTGDDLREDLNGMLIDDGGTRLRSSARVLWAVKKRHLEESIRRLDLLRMRFLVVYMGLIAAKNPVPDPPSYKELEKQRPVTPKKRPALPFGLAEAISEPPPLRRVTTQPMGHQAMGYNPLVGGGAPQGWAGVVAELQSSPLMHKRHASIENGMGSPRGGS
ncbi:hypothetical protein F5884DRAFT_286323 [Xylogone sp. PMI_703]|nr:hypothetical protein F5884DRAFT_286323 [Xylogone sp. PMI_703]